MSGVLVLVVDDDRYLLRATSRVFERAGLQVLTAENGAGALAALAGVTPHLVVTDMRMPVMDGADLVRRLREDPGTAHLPVIALTADAHLAVDADVVITKPYRPADLLAVAFRLLEVAGGGPTGRP